MLCRTCLRGVPAWIGLSAAIGLVLGAAGPSLADELAGVVQSGPATKGAAGVVQGKRAGLSIPVIQGRGHLSPYDGQYVEDIEGVVTLIGATEMFMQGEPDGDDLTSDGVLVQASPQLAASPIWARLKVGDSVRISGRVHEQQGTVRSGASIAANFALSRTTIRADQLQSLGRNLAIAPPVQVGPARRVPHAERVSDTNMQGFDIDPLHGDAMDFYESLEGMRVEVPQAVGVGPRQYVGYVQGARQVVPMVHGALWYTSNIDRGIWPDEAGWGAGFVRGTMFPIADLPFPLNRDGTGGLEAVRFAPSADFNPEVLWLADDFSRDGARLPSDIGTLAGALLTDQPGFPGAGITGVMDYQRGVYRVQATSPVVVAQIVSDRSAHHRYLEEVVSPQDGRLRVMSYNLRQLDSNDDDGDRDLQDGRFSIIVSHIGAVGWPAIVALQEVGDDNGADRSTNEANASATVRRLIDEAHVACAASSASVCPTYLGAWIEPSVDFGHTVRNVTLYDSSLLRLTPSWQGSGDATTSAELGAGSGYPVLSLNPGLIEPASPVNRCSRPSLVTQFESASMPSGSRARLTVVNVHFPSRLGSSPLFGALQPPFEAGKVDSEGCAGSGLIADAGRLPAAVIVRGFLDQGAKALEDAGVSMQNHHHLVLGDFNDFYWSEPIAALLRAERGAPLRNLTETVDAEFRYTHRFEHNMVAIDHALVSPTVGPGTRMGVLHVNLIDDRVLGLKPASDHDPLIIDLDIQNL